MYSVTSSGPLTICLSLKDLNKAVGEKTRKLDRATRVPGNSNVHVHVHPNAIAANGSTSRPAKHAEVESTCLLDVASKYMKALFCRHVTLSYFNPDIDSGQGRRSGYESGGDGIHVNPERSFGGTNGEPSSEASQLRKGVRGSSPGKFQKPTWQMVQSTLFLSYICEYY